MTAELLQNRTFRVSWQGVERWDLVLHGDSGPRRPTITGGGKRFYYSATVGSKDHLLHLKLVNASNGEQPLTIGLKGAKRVLATKAYMLHASTYEAVNSISDPEFIRPMESVIKVSGGSWKHAVPGLTIEMLDIPLE